MFSSQWIHDVEVAGDCHLVAIGPYVLPPSFVMQSKTTQQKYSTVEDLSFEASE